MSNRFKNFRSAFAVGLGSLAVAVVASARAPEAGTRIVNQAVVQYQDENGADRTATTNEVVLFVQQVFSGNISGDETRLVIPGGSVRFPHVLENTGNGSDTYCVQAVDKSGDDGDFTKLEVHLDSDGDGEIDVNSVVLNVSSDTDPGTLTLSSGEKANLIVRGFVPVDAVANENFDLSLLVSSRAATSACGGAIVTDIGSNADGSDGTNQDRATITANAVLEITKASSYIPGVAGDLSDDTIDYTLTVRNIGATSATDVLISDTLPANVTFDSFGTHDGAFSTGPTYLTGDVTAEAATIAVGDEFVIRFSTNIDPTIGFSGDARIVENTAAVDANIDGVAGRDGAIDSNTVSDEIALVYGVRISDIGGAPSPNINDGADDDGTIDDDQHVDSAAPGESVKFSLTVENTGNVIDTYNLVSGARLGWFNDAGIRFLNRDFSTPLLDTTGDGISDTGPIEPGDTFSFVVEAVMPFTEPAAPHSLTLNAVSTADRTDGVSNVQDPTGLSVGSAKNAGVDIANSSGASGFNDGGAIDADPSSAITTTKTTGPGILAEFSLFIANEGGGPDVFALSVSGNEAGTVPIGTGWSVSFKALDGTEISQTPRLNSGETYEFKAVVTPPENAVNQASQSLYFITESFETGVRDVKQDQVIVGIAPQIILTPDRYGQVAPCGFREYVHVLRNTGGTDEQLAITIDSQSNLTSQLWFPISVTGTGPTEYQNVSFLSVGDNVAVLEDGVWKTITLVSDGSNGIAIPLSPGDETRVKVRVLASCDVSSGAIDVLTLLAESLDADATASITDQTTVSNAQLTISKLGALDAACDSTADGSFADANIRANPGQCVIWEINVENAGTEPVCEVHSRDAAPSFTRLHGNPLIRSQPSPGTGVCTVNGSEFSCSLGNSLDLSLIHI